MATFALSTSEQASPAATPARERSPSVAIARGALALVSSQPLTWTATLLTTAFVPHYLGAAHFGQYIVALTVANLAGTAASLGVPEYLKRYVATHPDDAAAGGRAALALLVGVATAIAALLGLAAPRLHFLVSDPLVLRLALAGMVVLTAQNVLFALLIGLERHAQFAWLNAGAVALSAALGIGVLQIGSGVAAYTASVVAGNAIMLLAIARVAHASSLQPTLPKPAMAGKWGTWPAWRQIAYGGLPFLGWNFAIQVRNQIDVALVAALLGDRAAGWLAGAYRIVAIPAFIPTLIATPLYPALSRCAQSNDRVPFRKTLHDSFYGVLLLTVPASALIAGTAPALPALLRWGPDFARSVPLIRILSLSFPLMSVDVVLGTALFALHAERRWVRVAAGAAIFNPSLNMLIVPLCQRLWHNGAAGAAVVEVTTELIMCAGALLLLPKDVLDPRLAWMSLRTIFAGIGLAAVSALLLPTNVVLAGAAGLAVYALALLALRVLQPSQLHVVRAILPSHAGEVALARVD